MKFKWLPTLISSFTIALSLSLTILIFWQNSNLKSNLNNEQVEKKSLFNVYYSGSNDFPTSVILIENEPSGLFCFWNLGEEWQSTSPYCGNFIKYKDEFFLRFPTCDSRILIVSSDEAVFYDYRYKQSKSGMTQEESLRRFRKLATIKAFISTVKDFNTDQYERELPKYLQKAFTENSRSISKSKEED